MNKDSVIRDERYYAVENASFRIGYNTLSYGLLVLIVIRSMLYEQTNWDLFALLIISSFASTIYQLRHKTIAFSWKWVILFFGVMLFSAALVFLIIFLKK